MSSNGNTITKTASVAVAVATAVAAIVKLAEPIIDEAISKITHSRKPIVIPDLGSERFPLSINQAIERLHNSRLNATPIKMGINEADSKYRNCFSGQVIESRPKAGTRASVGQEISVKYITQEVIDESQRLYEQKLKKGKEKPLPPGDEAAER